MRKSIPYLLITLIFAFYIGIWHKGTLTYRFDQGTLQNYLRSQDIEDPNNKIKDRVWISDNDIYISAGYLYAMGDNPTDYNFQHPPLIKYLFGFSTLLTGNPFYIQIIFGLVLLFLTYYLGTKLFSNYITAYFGTFLLLIDPVFGGMMNEALLDLGQAVFALGYLILLFFSPSGWLIQGITLGFFATSKFWSTALIIVGLAYLYKIFLKKDKIDYKKTGLSFVTAFIVFCLIYRTFNIFPVQGRVLKFMFEHNSANILGGPLALFLSGYFLPWWKEGIVRAFDWSFLWSIGLMGSIFSAIRTKINDVRFFFYLLPLTYLFLSSTQVPFTRYFILILPFIYLSLANLIASLKSR